MTVSDLSDIPPAVEIGVQIPSLLRDCAGDRTRFTLVARTLQEAVDRLLETYPLLRLHLYDEADRLRPHVLIYFNDANIAWLDRFDVPLTAGDRLTVLQNVSGG
jgi:molybdopterin synthase sulfur carrier subunit